MFIALIPWDIFSNFIAFYSAFKCSRTLQCTTQQQPPKTYKPEKNDNEEKIKKNHFIKYADKILVPTGNCRNTYLWNVWIQKKEQNDTRRQYFLKISCARERRESRRSYKIAHKSGKSDERLIQRVIAGKLIKLFM